MSFKSREKKRAARVAIAKSRARSETMAGRRYLTIVSRHACCNDCGGSLRKGRECVYRHTPREILCVTCAQARKLHFRPSVRWERRQRQPRATDTPSK
jgi:hypothetical protein